MSNTAECSCVGKVAFTSFVLANNVVKRHSEKRTAARQPYHCGYCGMWHVGSSKKDTSKKSK